MRRIAAWKPGRCAMPSAKARALAGKDGSVRTRRIAVRMLLGGRLCVAEPQTEAAGGDPAGVELLVGADRDTHHRGTGSQAATAELLRIQLRAGGVAGGGAAQSGGRA